MLPAKWSRIVAVWLGWTSWEPWRSTYGLDLQKNTKKMREEAERAAKWRVEGKMISRAGIYRAQNIRRFAAMKGSTQRRRVSTQRHRDLRCNTPKYTLAVFGHVYGLMKVKYEFSGNKTIDLEINMRAKGKYVIYHLRT